jgi:hypothetical protein
MYIWSIECCGAENWTHRKVDDPGKFCNVVLDKDRADQLRRSCEELGSITYYRRVEEHST